MSNEPSNAELHDIRWAEERRRRIKAEERILAFQIEAGALVHACRDLQDAILDSEDKVSAEDVVSALAKLHDFALDLERQVNLTTIKPTWPTPDGYLEQIKQAKAAKDMNHVDRKYSTQMNQATEKAVQVTAKEWDELVAELGWVSFEEHRDISRNKFMAQVITKAARDAQQTSGSRTQNHTTH